MRDSLVGLGNESGQSKRCRLPAHLQISANNSATGDIYCKEQKDIGLKRTIQRKAISLGENERRKLRRRVLGLERIEWRKEVR